MATLKYKYNGFGGMKEMIADMTAYADEFVADGKEMFSEVIKDTALQQQFYIKEAVTRTGLKRASGSMTAAEAAIIDPLGLGELGRIRTGEMITEISHKVEATTTGPNRTTMNGQWGWLDGAWKNYFADQEEKYGVAMQGAHSIARSIVWGRNQLQQRIDMIVNGTRGRQ